MNSDTSSTSDPEDPKTTYITSILVIPEKEAYLLCPKKLSSSSKKSKKNLMKEKFADLLKKPKLSEHKRHQEEAAIFQHFSKDKSINVKIIYLRVNEDEVEKLMFRTKKLTLDSTDFKGMVTILLKKKQKDDAQLFYALQSMIKCFDSFNDFGLQELSWAPQQEMKALEKSLKPNLVMKSLDYCLESKSSKKWHFFMKMFGDCKNKYLTKNKQISQEKKDELCEQFIPFFKQDEEFDYKNCKRFLSNIYLLMDENKVNSFFDFIQTVFEKCPGLEEKILKSKTTDFNLPDDFTKKLFKKKILELLKSLFQMNQLAKKYEIVKNLIFEFFENMQTQFIAPKKFKLFLKFVVKVDSLEEIDYNFLFKYLFEFPIKDDLDFLINHKFQKKNFVYFLDFLYQILVYKHYKKIKNSEFKVFKEVLSTFIQKNSDALNEINQLSREKVKLLNKEFGFLEIEVEKNLQICLETSDDSEKKISAFLKNKIVNKYFHDKFYKGKKKNIENENILLSMESLLKDEAKVVLIGKIIFELLQSEKSPERFGVVKYISIQITKNVKNYSVQIQKNFEFKKAMLGWLSSGLFESDSKSLEKINDAILYQFEEQFGYDEKIEVLNIVGNFLKTVQTYEQKKIYKQFCSSLMISRKDFFADSVEFWQKLCELDLQQKAFRKIFTTGISYFLEKFVYVNSSNPKVQKLLFDIKQNESLPEGIMAHFKSQIVGSLNNEKSTRVFTNNTFSELTEMIVTFICLCTNENLLKILRIIRDHIQKQPEQVHRIYQDTALVRFLAQARDKYSQGQLVFSSAFAYKQMESESLINNYWSLDSNFNEPPNLNTIESVLRIGKVIKSSQFVSRILDRGKFDQLMNSFLNALPNQLLAEFQINPIFSALARYGNTIKKLNSRIFVNIFIYCLAKRFNFWLFEELLQSRQLEYLKLLHPDNAKSRKPEGFSISLDQFAQVLEDSKSILADLSKIDSKRDIVNTVVCKSIPALKLIMSGTSESDVEDLNISATKAEKNFRNIKDCVLFCINNRNIKKGLKFYFEFFPHWNEGRSILESLDFVNSDNYLIIHKRYVGLEEYIKQLLIVDTPAYKFLIDFYQNHKSKLHSPHLNKNNSFLTPRRLATDPAKVHKGEQNDLRAVLRHPDPIQRNQRHRLVPETAALPEHHPLFLRSEGPHAEPPRLGRELPRGPEV